MITFREYHEILANLKSQGIKSRAVKSLISRAPQRGDLYLKHDVEARPELALDMARIEASFDHVATYYFQGHLLETSSGKMAAVEIARLGHEVSYHFDVLDANDGNWEAAQTEFDRYCAIFAQIGCPVQTVCPHGNPTKNRDGWNSNKDFFREKKVRLAYPDILDIVIDFSEKVPEGCYVSDAGRKLRLIGNIAGNDVSNTAAMDDGTALEWDDLTALLTGNKGLLVSLHPHRFATSASTIYIQKYGFKILKTTYLVIRRVPLVSKLASRFYYLARRF